MSRLRIPFLHAIHRFHGSGLRGSCRIRCAPNADGTAHPHRSALVAVIAGSMSRPRSVAIVSAYDDSDLERPVSTLGLCIIDADGERFTGTLADLTGGEPFLHIELLESFDQRRGYARKIIDSLSGTDLIVSPTPEAVCAYDRLGFLRTPVYDSIFDRPLMRKPA